MNLSNPFKRKPKQPDGDDTVDVEDFGTNDEVRKKQMMPMGGVGAVALVAGWVARNSPAGATVAAIFPDGPQRYFDTIYNDDYCRAHGLLDAAPPRHPATIEDPMTQTVTAWTRCTTVVDPTEVQPR